MREVERARILLKYHTGKNLSAIHRALNISCVTISGCRNETKLVYGSSPVEFGAGLSLPGGIVIAIAPTVPFAELLETRKP